MALKIPNTHKNLPSGLQPEDFGQVGYCDDPGLFVISALSSPIYIGTELNQYALFVKSSLSINSIKWKVKFKASTDEVEGEFEATGFDDKFVFTFNLIDIISEVGELTVEATINHSTGENTISIHQAIIFSDVIDYLSISYIAFAGNKKVTSRLINNYRPYILNALVENHHLFGALDDIPESLLAAYISNFINPFFNEICLDDDFKSTESIGVCKIHPALVGHIFKSPSENDEINLLRFPKTNILICGHLLSKIKNVYPQWANFNSNQLVNKPEAVIFLTQALYDTSYPDYFNNYQSLEKALNNLEEIKNLDHSDQKYFSGFKQGIRINKTMGLPWCRTFFYGEKNIKGGIYDENEKGLKIANVRVDVFWEIDKISKAIIDKRNEKYSKEFRVRIVENNLSVFNQTNFSDASKQGNENIKLKKWQVFKLLDIFETTDTKGRKLEWYKIKYQNNEKWIVAFSGKPFAQFEEVVKIDFYEDVKTDANGKFNFTVYDTGLYFIRTIKESRYNDGTTRDYYDGEFGWFLAADSNVELVLQMQSEDALALWVCENEILSVCDEFDENWIYDNGDGHYPKDIPDVGIKNSHRVDAGASKKTDCVTFAETCIMYSWQKKYSDLKLSLSQHKAWTNSNNLEYWEGSGGTNDFSKRLSSVLDPVIDLKIGTKAYARDENQDTIQFPTNSKKFESFLPEPWSLVQYYRNDYTVDNVNEALAGHQCFILDTCRDPDDDKDCWILILESNNSELGEGDVFFSVNNSGKKDGVQIRKMLHISLLNNFKDSINNMRQFSRDWPTFTSIEKWSDFKNKNSIMVVKLHIYNLEFTRPPKRRIKKIL
jgi:hypothetical protein